MDETETGPLRHQMKRLGLGLVICGYVLLIIAMPPPMTGLPVMLGLVQMFALPLVISLGVFLLLVPGAVLVARSVEFEFNSAPGRALAQAQLAAGVLVPFVVYLRLATGYAIGVPVALTILGIPAALCVLGWLIVPS